MTKGFLNDRSAKYFTVLSKIDTLGITFSGLFEPNLDVSIETFVLFSGFFEPNLEVSIDTFDPF